MVPKTKEISLDMRKHITELHKQGKSFREIGKILKLSFTTVGYMVKKYLETGIVESKPRPVGPSKLTSRAKRMIVRSATNKLMTSAQNIVNELLSRNVSVSAQTVKNVLHSADLKARSPQKKPYISENSNHVKCAFTWASGATNNAPDYGSGDSKFESWFFRDHLISSAKRFGNLKIHTDLCNVGQWNTPDYGSGDSRKIETTTVSLPQDRVKKSAAFEVSGVDLAGFSPRRAHTLGDKPKKRQARMRWRQVNIAGQGGS
ncbi:paired domain-containing protein [Trichonephila clavipes]|nr:paired domain-containing protein [Trichonephila clavipes]